MKKHALPILIGLMLTITIVVMDNFYLNNQTVTFGTLTSFPNLTKTVHGLSSTIEINTDWNDDTSEIPEVTVTKIQRFTGHEEVIGHCFFLYQGERGTYLTCFEETDLNSKKINWAKMNSRQFVIDLGQIN